MLDPVDFERLRASLPIFSGLRHVLLHSYDRSNAKQSPVSIFGSVRELRLLSNPRSAAPFGTYPFLTALELRDISAPTLLEVLARCPQLLHPKASLNRPRNGLMPLTAARTLGLKSLFIAAYTGYSPLPPVLNFPALSKLRRLDLYHDPQFAVLASFLARSPCVLDHLGLTIGAENETRKELPDILRTFPSLASLDIHAGSDIMTIMYLLSCTSAVTGAPRDIVPELKTLTITTWNKDFHFWAFAEIPSRTQSFWSHST